MNPAARVVPLVLALALTAPLRAELVPYSGGADGRVRTVAYNPMNVVQIVASATISTQLIFAEQEEITNVSVGDDASWLVQPVGHLLFLKPIGPRRSTNGQVVTRRADGSMRSYQLHLIAVPRAAGAAVYAVAFTYPQDVAAAAVAARVQASTVAAKVSAEDHLADAWAQGPRNWRYVAQGSVMIQPTEVSDNGRMTAFRFPGNMRIPTIYATAPDGTEAIVPYTMTGDRAVVQTTARTFVLRDGKEVLRVLNQGFDPVGRNPGTGTGTAEVSRTIRSPAP